MKQLFNTSELKEIIESFYGVRLLDLQKINTGAQSLNFMATASGIGKFVIKAVPTHEDAQRIVSNCRLVRLANGVDCLFDGKIASFQGCYVLCLSYCAGQEIRFEEYDFVLVDELVEKYVKLSRLMRGAENPHPSRDVAELIQSLDQLSKDLPRSNIYRAVIDECVCKGRECLNDDNMQVVHGDFHFANFRYLNGSLAGVFDFMEFRRGYPTEDFIRLVLCCAERLRWYRVHKMRKIVKLFAYLVSKTDYPYWQWESAINGYLLRKMVKKAKEGKRGLFFALDMRLRMRLYRRLKAIAFACVEKRA